MTFSRALAASLLPPTILVWLVAQQACSSSSGGVSPDAADTADDALDTADAAQPDSTPADTVCTEPWDGPGRQCSPTVPCPPPSQCWYTPGCVDPIGYCQLWEICPMADATSEVSVCACEGGPGTEKAPFSHYGACTD